MPKATILIVEDEAIVAEDLSLKLIHLGYQICGTSARGEEAVALARERRPDLILMDICLQGQMDGVEAANIIRQTCDLPVIFLTAHSDQSTLQRAMLTEPFGYLLKPFEEMELAPHIEMALYKHQVEQKLRQQREWLQVTLQSIGDAVITTDAAGKVTSLNPVAEALTGWSVADALYRPIEEVFNIINEDTRQPAFNPVEKVIKLGKIVGLANHTAVISRDGKERSIEDSAAPITNAQGQIIGVVMVFHDVTERRRMEEARYRLAAIVESSADAIISKNLDGIITSWNQSADRLFGFRAEETIGKHISLIIPPDQQAEEVAILQRLRNGEFIDHHETFRQAKNGRTIPVSLTISPIRDASGTIIGASKIVRDMTERRRADELLQSQSKHLEALVRERTARLQEMVGELEHFSYTITHDMRAPLRAMIGYGGILLETNDNLSATSKQFIERISSSAKRMDDLITDALNYNKLVSQEVELQPVDCGVLLREIIDSYPQYHEAKAGICIAGKIPAVMGNSAALIQCCSNLLNNAIKFVEPGKVPQLRIRSEDRGEWVRIWFEDNGIGISPEYQEKIFVMFQRLSTAYEGTGIGLALVRKAAERMGGKVGVESEPGKGSRFWLELKQVNAN